MNVFLKAAHLSPQSLCLQAGDFQILQRQDLGETDSVPDRMFGGEGP